MEDGAMVRDTGRHIAGDTMFVSEIAKITSAPEAAVRRYAHVRGLTVRGLQGEGRRNRVLVREYLAAIREHYPTEHAALAAHLDGAASTQQAV